MPIPEPHREREIAPGHILALPPLGLDDAELPRLAQAPGGAGPGDEGPKGPKSGLTDLEGLSLPPAP